MFCLSLNCLDGTFDYQQQKDTDHERPEVVVFGASSKRDLERLESCQRRSLRESREMIIKSAISGCAALQLIMTDFVDVVELESPDINVIDDVVIKYSTPVKDHGGLFEIDYCQLKYHVAQNGSFSFEVMLDPAFTRTKDPFLQRLYDTYVALKARHGDRPFRMPDLYPPGRGIPMMCWRAAGQRKVT